MPAFCYSPVNHDLGRIRRNLNFIQQHLNVGINLIGQENGFSLEIKLDRLCQIFFDCPEALEVKPQRLHQVIASLGLFCFGKKVQCQRNRIPFLLVFDLFVALLGQSIVNPIISIVLPGVNLLKFLNVIGRFSLNYLFVFLLKFLVGIYLAEHGSGGNINLDVRYQVLQSALLGFLNVIVNPLFNTVTNADIISVFGRFGVEPGGLWIGVIFLYG